jgi:hypothetical protein
MRVAVLVRVGVAKYSTVFISLVNKEISNQPTTKSSKWKNDSMMMRRVELFAVSRGLPSILEAFFWYLFFISSRKIRDS